MENYHRRPKASKSKFENDDDSTSNTTGISKTTTQHHNRPQQHGVMVISPNGKIRTYVTRALEILVEADASDTQQDFDPESNNQKKSEKGKSKPSSIPAQSTKPAASASSGPSIPSTSNPTPTPTSISSHLSKPSSTQGVLTIKAQGRSITKAVTVAEILKRRMEGSLHQFTEIGQVTEQEIWDPNPDKPNLDPITVSRHRPTIRIRLSKYLEVHATAGTGLTGVDSTMPGASIPRDEHTDDDDDDDHNDGDENGDGGGEAWPGAILDRDAAARRFVGYQAPTGNDIYL
ncbi:hypothetical protein BC939DRAFT_438648 [Gamsiella multidivaricata]|uniref:uncharacterized protein n=1 Tax=Gamsiella multidivaricata TaxID=101098 RepID=UPI002220C144|nr:uncharacterized protein BC939DRAFT_438648 [Gamsiella multidivaricata]KAG0359472.1 hypothetical protein BGZ54_009957 [Gamsiella multidivaricata]KAI7830650.1 hypothetical protein BC939DRAFT_438648 [Gamsiella multidivaricata]